MKTIVTGVSIAVMVRSILVETKVIMTIGIFVWKVIIASL